ncbi:hypothetical protein G1C96_0400 [Bifidobacterium sp. DSM 109958]|uniref:Uncharacterized protein n=1 Tax=Bifidobacterium moraviense TaxID=2675323 RepID=A0A7Y0F0K1_9BIFI|nr:hypothetical protein [Bifidobacterium sp. DSM 109958]NMM99822.1 hypothetical protein [Bifidobacterium sp. DSM 109958]
MSSPDIFEANIAFPGTTNPVHVRICRYVPEDMTQQRSIALASAAMQLARVGMDVVLGRTSADRLAKAANAVIVRKLDTMSLLYRSYLQRRPGLMRRVRATVTEAVGVEAFVRSADHMEMSVHLRVAGNDYWSSVVFDRAGGRWMCTELDLG